MAEITRETITTNTVRPANTVAPVRPAASGDGSSFTTQNLIYFLFGVLEFLLVFRLVFKIMGANPRSGFVAFVYGLTGPFTLPFQGIFRQAATQGLETTSILEPATIVAIMVYALLSWGIVKLIAIMNKDPEV